MGRRKKGARVLGPYKERDRRGKLFYRVVQVDHAGATTTHFAKTKRKADLLVRACAIDLGVPHDSVITVTDAIEAFEEQKRKARAWDKRTFSRTGRDLRFFAAHAPNAPIDVVNVLWLRSLLERMADAGNSLAYQKGRYFAVVEFLGWCRRRGLIRENPAELIDPLEKPWRGKRARRLMGRGKPQLRNKREAIAYLEAARKLDSAMERVAVQLPLLTNMRSGAVRHLQVGDIDFDAGRIWVRELEDDDLDISWDPKTATSRRRVDLPEALTADLAEMCEGKDATELLFPSNRNLGRPWDRQWLNRRVQKVCEAAGVRVVCTQGLRGTYASILADEGYELPDIGRLLGHADGGKTAAQHYAGAPQRTRELRLIEGGR